MLLEIYEIIVTFVLVYPILSVYLMGSMIAIGIVYTLMSSGDLVPKIARKTYIISAISSWIVVIAFLYGFLKGFFEILFKENNKGGQ